MGGIYRYNGGRMDNLFRAIILSLFFVLPASANSWVPKWIDGPASATYDRTATSMRTYVDMPKYGGNVQWTLNSSAPSGSITGAHVGPASTSSIPKVASIVKIPYGYAAGAAGIATLTAIIPKLSLAKAALALVRFNPYLSTALTVGWIASAGYSLLTASDGTNTINTVNYSSDVCLAPCLAQWGSSCVGTFVEMNNKPIFGGTNYQCGGYWPGGSPHLLFAMANSGNTSNISTPVNDDVAAPQLASSPISAGGDTASKLDGVIKETMDNGFNPDTDGATPTLTGSTSPVQGPKQTITAPDGTVTTTNTTYTPSYTNNYSDVAETTVTTVTNNSNTTTSTTTGPANTPAQAQEQQTDCDKYPDSIGCAKFGDIPVKDTIPLTNVSMSLTPSSLGSGTCPAPVVLTLHGQPNITLSYQRYCDFASMLSPFVVSLAYLSAGLIVLGSIREA